MHSYNRLVGDFRDLEFDHEFRTVLDQEGSAVRRWVPVGMPRIAQNLERCVFFLFGHDPRTGAVIGPGGTGFFVAKSSKALDCMFHLYAVSNRHTVQQTPCIRINKNEHETRLLEFDPSEWVWSDTDDLAAVDVTDLISFNPWADDISDRISVVNDFQIVSRQRAWERDIGIGDQTLMLGLFADHSGGDKNIPVARFGFVSATPDESTPVRLWPSDPLARPAYLNDMRSRSGFSGSPVWIWRTPYDDMNEVGLNGLAQRFNPRNTLFGLLGVHRGQFREQAVIRLMEAEQVIKSGDEIEIASSMTVVVPAWEISILLDKDVFQTQRAIRDTRNERIETARIMGRALRPSE